MPEDEYEKPKLRRTQESKFELSHGDKSDKDDSKKSDGDSKKSTPKK